MTKFEVTQEILDTAIPESITDCMVAAVVLPFIKEKTGRDDVFVGAGYLMSTTYGKNFSIKFPVGLRERQYLFDTNQFVAPFSFELDLSPLGL